MRDAKMLGGGDGRDCGLWGAIPARGLSDAGSAAEATQAGGDLLYGQVDIGIKPDFQRAREPRRFDGDRGGEGRPS